jgi:hypothetical protein
MARFSIPSGPGLLTVALAMVLGYCVLRAPEAPVEQPAAAEIAAHSTDCTVCRLSLYGHDGQASKLGPESHDNGAEAVSALQ